MLRGKVWYKKNPPTRALVGLRGIKEDLDGALIRALSRLAKDMETYAKRNAPWTDRTGRARENLKGYHGAYGSPKGKTYYAAVKHGDSIYYGIYLEVRFNGRWGIIWRTQEAYKGQIGRYLREELDKVAR